MPDLDRRIRLKIAADQFDVDSVAVDVDVWARRTDVVGEVAQDAQAGDRRLDVRTYSLRWRADLVETLTSRVSIVEGPTTYHVTGRRETGDRNRFVDLDVVAEA